MKATNYLIIMLMAVFMSIACNSNDIIGEKPYSGKPFARFYLVLDNNNLPLGNQKIDNSNVAVSEYTHTTLRTLKIPVALSSQPIDQDITVNFSTLATGGFDGYEIEPKGVLSFSKEKYVDTIYVRFTKRWEAENDTRIEFELTSVSNTNVHLGNLNDYQTNKKLSIVLSEIETTCSLSANRMEINGKAGEQIEFDVLFSEGFLASEISNDNLFDIAGEFSYTLEHKPYAEGDSKITYIFTVNENVDNDYFLYQTVVKLKTEGLYLPKGTKILQVVKPIKIERDKNANPAGKFYNLNDPYYRTFGENWMDYNSDNVCEWTAFNAFTFPVVVDATHPHAVLYSDKGTPQTDDDVYYHAFRVGFNTLNAGNTVNSFNLKRWFNNEAINASVSPGFNIIEALEFYPANGNSTTNGMVMVISQYLTISGTNGNSYTIGISGEGTYSQISDGLFEISLELKAENAALFGGVRVSKYKIYNLAVYPAPAAIEEACFGVIDL